MRVTCPYPSPAFSSENCIAYFFIITGFVPVSCIAINVLEIIPLHQTSIIITLPLMLLAIIVGILNREVGKKALRGWICGVLAVCLYDVSRIPFILSGWEDFIPKIGDWILNKEGTSGVIGYLWRYAGNGGGMGIAYVFIAESIGRNVAKQSFGILYGLAIFTCLMMVLLFSENGQNLMFKVTFLTFIGSMLGHVVYGYCLDKIYRKCFMNN